MKNTSFLSLFLKENNTLYREMFQMKGRHIRNLRNILEMKLIVFSFRLRGLEIKYMAFKNEENYLLFLV